MQIAPLQMFVFTQINVVALVVDTDALREITQTLEGLLDYHISGPSVNRFLFAIVSLSLCRVWCERY